MTLEVARQAASLGAYVSGVDLSQPLDDGLFEHLHAAFLEHHVLCFRDQDLKPAQQLAFAARWGKVWIHPYVPSVEGHPGVMELGDPHPITLHWHSDTTHAAAPPRMSMLLARRVPPFGEQVDPGRQLFQFNIFVGSMRLGDVPGTTND